ncbi:hypothetical protein AHAS_Ahas09G0270400 [Arachis hypogaea]
MAAAALLFNLCSPLTSIAAPPPPPPTIFPNPLLSLFSTTKPSLNPLPLPQHVPLASTTTTLQFPSHNSTNTCLSSPFSMTTKNHVKYVVSLESTKTPKPPPLLPRTPHSPASWLRRCRLDQLFGPLFVCNLPPRP